MFWSQTKSKPTPCPDDLSQAWILDGFKESIDGFFIAQGDPQGNFPGENDPMDHFYVSPKFLNMVGYTNAEKHINDIEWWQDQIHPEDKKRVISYMIMRRSGTNERKQIECRFRHRAGHWLWLLVQTHVHHPNSVEEEESEGDGRKSGWIMGAVTNISSYRVLQDQLERTIEEGELTSQAKSKFIASLNHELRTPLNGIIGMSNFLKESALSPEQIGYVENVAASAQLLLSLVNDILDVSKITAGKLDLEEHEFDLSLNLHRTSSLLKPLADLKKLEFQLSIDNNVPKWVLGDQVRLQQILTNLLNNAIKFTDKGKITLSVQLRDSCQRDNSKEVLVLFKVIDSGSGISAAVLPKLFQDFTQADSSVTRTHGGTGLGLSICKKLVSLMRGEIGVQSTLGKGSTFWFSVPYVPLEAASEFESQGIVSPLKDISQTTILVAEDNLINQQVMMGLIHNLGGETIIAHNGKEAVDRFVGILKEGKGVDIIFMDINMPQMNGYEATAALRALPEGKTIPIIACTADTITHSHSEFLAKGFTDVISKPINKQDLSDVLQKYGREDSAGADKIANPQKEKATVSPNVVDPLINKKVIETLREDIGADVVDTLLATYRVDAKQIVDQLLEEESIQEAHNLAHALAGISENLGFQAVGQISRTLMVSIHDKISKQVDDVQVKQDDELLGLITQIQSQFEASVKAIDAL